MRERVIVELLEDGYVRGSAKAGDQVDATHLSKSEVDNLVKLKKAKRVTIATVEEGDAAELTALKDQVQQLKGQLAATSPLTLASLQAADVKTVTEHLTSGAWDADTVETLEAAGKKRQGVTEAIAKRREPAATQDGQ